MSEPMSDSVLKAGESSLHMQQESIKQCRHQWPSMPLNAPGVSAEWFRSFQHGWIEFMTDTLIKHRESLDSTYKSGIQVIEQTVRLSEPKTPDDYRGMVEEIWRKVFGMYKEQSETQIREFQKGVEKLFETATKAKV
jgi:hypothetical protein